MKTEKNILIAFLLNLFFSIFEFFGGIYTGSVAIISDAIHDIGDAASIGISYFMEKKSKKQPDKNYTYGYSRYSVIGGMITTIILIVGSLMVMYNAIVKIINPTTINYNGMIVFAVVGVVVNLIAAIATRDGDSLNQKAVNLHMLEDVLGWIVVLIGAVIMRFTNISIIDPIMSIGVAIFILINAIGNLREVIDLFLEKTPHGINIDEIKKHIENIHGVIDVHHMHIWSMDGQNNYATMHVVTNDDPSHVKKHIREEMHEHGISHVTIEIETEGEECNDRHCHVSHNKSSHCHHHHGHGHHHHH